MYMRSIILLFIFFAGLSGYGQATYSYGVKLAGGASKIAMTGDASTFETSLAPSGFAGLFYQTKVGKRGLFGAEAGVSQVEGRWSSSSPITDGSGNQIGTSTTTGKQHITLIQPSVYGGVTIENLSLYVGPQLGIIMNASGSDETVDVIGSTETNSSNEGNLSVTNLNYSIHAGLILKVSKKVSLEASYAHGLANIFDNSQNTNFVWNTRQILVGARFAIRNTNDCGTCPAWN